MEKGLGIGGLFFRAQDPGKSRYPLELRGITLAAGGRTVGGQSFSGRDGLPWGFQAGNFRVRDLEAMVAQLRLAGIAVDVDPQAYPNGRFARLRDPEGNPIELWQPAGRDAPSYSHVR